MPRKYTEEQFICAWVECLGGLTAVATHLQMAKRAVYGRKQGIESRGFWRLPNGRAPEWIGPGPAPQWWRDYVAKNALARIAQPPAFERKALPTGRPALPDLIAERIKRSQLKMEAAKARRLIPIRVNLDGPIGIVHTGDPHVDDDGCDWATLAAHVDIIRRTEGMLAGNVGDLTNNWVGRLSRLYANQATTRADAVELAAWLIKALPWLYLVRGNHDAWSGDGDVLEWFATGSAGAADDFAVRIGLQLPGGREVRINARHDFKGHSQWNTAHGPAKAAQMGWRDHILTCGHLHISGYQMLKCPATGLLSHAIRVASYKRVDAFATEHGLPDQNISPAVVTIIDPRWPDDSPRFVTVYHDVEEAADVLAWKRSRKTA